MKLKMLIYAIKLIVLYSSVLHAQDSTYTDSIVYSHKNDMIKIYLCDGIVLECDDIDKHWTAGPSNSFPFYQVTINGFNCWDGSVRFGLDIYNIPIIQGVPDSVQAIGGAQLSAIEKIVYPNGDIVTYEEIHSMNRNWTIGIIVGVVVTIASIIFL